MCFIFLKLIFSLKIPKNTIPPTEQLDPQDLDIFTPETMAVHKLEKISQDIMLNYPSQLDNPISAMLKFTKNGEGVENYEAFTRVAQPVYEMKIEEENNRAINNNNRSTGWSRLAMVLYVVRETFVLGNLNDKQMELLVEHSTKFFIENAFDSVNDETYSEVIIH